MAPQASERLVAEPWEAYAWNMSSQETEQPGLGWAVVISPEQTERRRRREERFRRFATPRRVLLAVLIIWNTSGTVFFIGALQSSDTPRQVVLTIVIWTWVLGDAAILGAGFLVRRFLLNRHPT